MGYQSPVVASLAQTQLLMNFLKRNNPVEAVFLQVANTVYYVVTFQSRVKIQKYKLLLEVEKLEKMQKSMTENPVYQAKTTVMNRFY